MTTTLAKTKRVIGIENLNISGMMKNHCLAQAISDLGLFVNLEYIAVSSTEMKNACGEASSDVAIPRETSFVEAGNRQVFEHVS